MKVLRKLEYYTNLQKRNPLQQFMFYYYGHKLGKYKAITGIDLDANVAGPGLRISHGKCVVSVDARLGSGCKILSDVTIGKLGPYNKDGAPRIGNNVYIGTGARIIGDIEIADDVVIGANAVVTKSITEKGITVAGIPAKKISDTDSWWYIHRVPREES
ncbi:MAG: serine acetyltransferase [Ruminococcus sp.]|nr:serine acetyltransferase [Ruminococcus sp.]